MKAGQPEDAAFIMKNASKIIVVPGYGMAVAQAQQVLREIDGPADRRKGVEIKYAIHPVAGRMPGHMNVLLAEANVPLRRGVRDSRRSTPNSHEADVALRHRRQ